MKQKNELVYYIQANYGGDCGWEDVSGYPMGYRQENFREQYELLKHDLREYRMSGDGAIYRVIKRYEEMENDN